MNLNNNDDDFGDLLDAEENDSSQQQKPRSSASTEKMSDSKNKNRNGATPALDKFASDITAAAENGRLDPVVGRETEIERVAQILSRRKKNNPVLIGDPGVGKSAIVEGLAQRIADKKVSRILHGKRLLSLNMAQVVAGTKYRGQFEERLMTIIDELQQHPEIILFIDEIHTIIGAGNAEGSMDAANILKPALARGEIQCIGATTTEEYRKSIEKDGALERRFQKILVEPTTLEETLQILQNIKTQYEDHHNVIYTPEALQACVHYADQYITDRSFPDKAIDIMDEAGSRVHIVNLTTSKEIVQQEQFIEQMKQRKNQAVADQKFELAADLRDQEKQLEAQLSLMRKEWEEKERSNRVSINAQDIAKVVSMISGVPVENIASAESRRLKDMDRKLKQKVIQQDKAVDTIVRAIKRGRAGLKRTDKPIGTFLFLGPTGVGKTLLAKQLATIMFGADSALIRIDMSEYMEKFAVSRLVGAPPGYVGYEEGGQLTEKVRRHPYSIILLDEIEKAHADVYNMLLQVMDEGRLTDSNGRTVDFRNTIIIMTSNVGSRQVKEFGKGIGFSSGTDANVNAGDLIRKALNRTFAPEFINRIDEIITFDQLSKEAVKQIVNIELNNLVKRVADKGINVKFSAGAIDFLADKGYNPDYGARPLNRAIQTYVEDKLSEMIIDGECGYGQTVRVGLARNGKLSFKVTDKMADK